LKNVPKNSPEN